MLIATGYELPFRFFYSPDAFVGSGDLELFVKFRFNEGREVVLERLQLFVSLANSGALGDPENSPWDSALDVFDFEQVEQNRLRWSLRYRSLSQPSLVVLAHLMFSAHERASIESVRVLTTSSKDINLLYTDPAGRSSYPQANRSVRFAFEDFEPEGGGINVYSVAQASPSDEHVKSLNVALGAWASAILHGGYALAPIHLNRSFIEKPEQNAIFYDSTIEFAVFKITADIDAASSALLNIFSRFDRLCVPLRSLEFS